MSSLTIVGASPITNISESFAVNEGGQVGGQEDAAFPFIWTPTIPNGTTGTSQRLPLLPTGGPAEGTVTAININGDAVGFADALDPSGASVTRAVFWSVGGTVVQELGTLIPNPALPGTFLGNSRAFGINDRGVIVGVSDSVMGVEHAFIFEPAVGFMRDLGSLVSLQMLPGTPDPSRALDINNQGDVVGEATAADAAGNLVLRAFLLPSGAFAMQDLGTLLRDFSNPGQFLGESAAFAINDNGMIVGMADAGIPTQSQKTPAFFQPGSAPTGMVPAIGSASDVNQTNVAVGAFGSGPTDGFQFSSASGVIDLNSFVTTPGLTILRGVGINSAGQIAATATDGTTTRAVLITP